MSWEGLTPPYSTIVVDPPWLYDDAVGGWLRQTVRAGRSFLPYSAMPLEDIAALPVVDLAAPGAHLYLWTTNRYLWATRDIALGWGFEPVQVLVWCKPPRLGYGSSFANATEFIVSARRTVKADRQIERAGPLIRTARETAGINRAELHRLVRGGTPTGIVARWEDNDSLPNGRDWAKLQRVLPALAGVQRPTVPPPPPPRESNRIDRNWFEWPRGAHSEKPAAFLDLVEHVSPGPYVELFARQPRLGWDSWGWGYESSAAHAG